jgi:hypothetical protein
MSNQVNLVNEVVDNLIEDSEFTQKIDTLIQEIMSDGKISHSDSPKIILLVIETYNNIKTVKLLYDQIPDLVRGVTNHILEEKNLIPDDQKENFKDMIETAVKLVMIQPKVKDFCLKKLFCCK